MESSHTVDIELLCSQAPWLRDLARHLVRDPAAADDLAQETLLAALEVPPPDAADVHRLRAWLRRVAINLAHLSTRRTLRRRAREERVAQNDRLDSAADLVLRDALRVRVSEAIGSLEEPYRSTVRLRYYEGASTADIALRMGTTDNAVRKRLFRARTKLRASLDAVHRGDRLAWFSGLLPWRLMAGRARALRVAPLALGAGAVAAVALALAATPRPVALAAPAVPERVATLAPAAAEAAAPLARLPLGPRAALGAGDGATAPLETPPPAPQAEPASPDVPGLPRAATEAPRTLSVAGRVLDLSGAPVADLPLRLRGRADAPPLGWSGRDGGFAFTLAADEVQDDGDAQAALVAGDERWATVRAAALDARAALEERVVVVARAVRVAGRTLDETGAPLAGVAVELEAEERAFAAIDARLSSTLLAAARATSDALGRFELESVPSGEGLALVAALRGPGGEVERAARVGVPAQDASSLEIRLAAPAAPPLTLCGIVRFEDGTPAPATTVRLGRHAAQTDERGAFRFRVREVPPGATLTATRPGFRQLRLDDLARRMAELSDAPPGDDPAPLRVALVLVESRGAIDGQVRDAAGRPCAGWVVRAEAGDEPGRELAQGATATLTDADGRFALEELPEREHRLLAWDPRTLLSTRSDRVHTGETVTLALADAPLARVVGRVLDLEGAPVADALVRVALALDDGEERPEGAHAFARGARSDELGWFELRDVPAGAEVAVSADGVEVHERVASGADELAIRLPRPHPLRVQTALLEADAFALLDASGQEIPLAGLERETVRRGRLHRGTSIVYASLGAEATELVIFQGEDEVERLRVDGEGGPLAPRR